MPRCPNSVRMARPCIATALVLVHILTVCLYQTQSAPVSSVYNRSPFSYRRYDQTSLPNTRHQQQFTNAFKEAVADVRTSLKTHADNFNVFFRDLLKLSHHNFNKMFSETYGLLYDKHAAIFNDMFRDLEKYYATGTVDLAASMKHFFSLLYRKMFEELNAQYAFDSTYLNCTVEHMEEMMPFGELPQKLILQIKRSFIGIRTFVHALRLGNEVLKTIMEVPFISSCENRLQSMSYCRNCAGVPNNLNLMCQDTCAKLLDKACFPYSANLNREWNSYLNEINNLAGRLKTSFNIELAVKPINIQISEAIMTFQENAQTITNRLFTKCGKPSPKGSSVSRRNKRNPYLYGNSQRFPAKPTYTTSPPQSQVTMESLIDDILKNIKSYKNFWARIPRHLCSQYSNSHSNCNNQTQRNVEPLNYKDKNSVEIINQQTNTLKFISANVKNAFKGLDVDFENNVKHNEGIGGNVSEDDEISFSGDEDLSGSGESEDDDRPTTAMPDPNRNDHHSSTTLNDDLYFTSTVPTTTRTESSTTLGKSSFGNSQPRPTKASANRLVAGQCYWTLLSLILGAFVLHRKLLVDLYIVL